MSNTCQETERSTKNPGSDGKCAESAASRSKVLATLGYRVGAAAMGAGLHFAFRNGDWSESKEPRLGLVRMRGDGSVTLAGGL